MLKRIGAEESGEFKAVASGTLPCGKPVVVNADGTVAVVSETVNTESVGSGVVFETANTQGLAVTYDTSNDKVVIVFRDSGANGQAIVGTVSGNSISFGTPVQFESGDVNNNSVVFDSSNNKVIISYVDTGNSDYGTSVVGTVSGTSISFGTPVVYNSGGTSFVSSAFDTSANKVVIAYSESGGKAIVGTVSGTSISFGSEVQFESGGTYNTAVAYDANANKTVIAYRDNGDSDKGKAVVGTVSGTSISFGSIVNFDTGNSRDIVMSYDPVAQKILLVYKILSSPNPGYSIVGTVSGTSISFGTRVEYHSGSTDVNRVVYDSAAQKHVILFRDQDTSPYRGKIRVATISGTSVSYSDEFTWSSTSFSEPAITYDPDQEKVVLAYVDSNNSTYGTARVYQTGYTEQNLTSENYIGMSRGVVTQTGSAASVGTPVVWEAADTQSISATFDSSSNKVVVAYMDNGNSSKGTYVVGTVSGTAISFGSPAVYTSGQPNPVNATFDSNSNKVVFTYRDGANSNYGTAIVGTVSGTSITFGSAVIFNSASSAYVQGTFDSNSNKIVIAYRDYASPSYGKAIVGTVSGNSISFGSAATFESDTIWSAIATFDSNSNKVVIGFRDGGDSNKTKAIVGTVSGTSISFGSAVVVSTRTISGFTGHTVTFDSSNNKVVFAYNDSGSSYAGYAIVGTVSGTSISFGSEATFATGGTYDVSATFDSNANKVNIAYRDNGNSDYGTMAIGTVSGTSISFATPVVYEAAKAEAQSAVFDSSNNRVVVSYKDNGNSNHGTSNVFKNDDSGVTRAEVASGQAASMDIIGSVSDNQIGLTAGQQYFVQTDGTIGTTAATPSVLAGTAISATELVVKT